MSKKGTRYSNTFGAKPLGDRVFIKEIDEKTKKTSTGIYIPETVKEDRGAKKGVVVAVGDGRYDDGVQIPVAVKKGDTVLFQWGDQVTIDGEEVYIVRESEIIAIIG